MRVSDFPRSDNGKFDPCDLELVFQLTTLSTSFLSMVQEGANKGLDKVLGKDYCDDLPVSFSFSYFLYTLLLSYSP